jgi:hypothetical protein
LHTLGDLSITELDLNAHSSTAMDHGNLLGLVSSYKTADGQSHEMADVWFSKQPSAAASTTTPTTAPDSATAAQADQHAAATTTALPVGLHDVLVAPGPDLLQHLNTNTASSGMDPSATVNSGYVDLRHLTAIPDDDAHKNILI